VGVAVGVGVVVGVTVGVEVGVGVLVGVGVAVVDWVRNRGSMFFMARVGAGVEVAMRTPTEGRGTLAKVATGANRNREIIEAKNNIAIVLVFIILPIV